MSQALLERQFSHSTFPELGSVGMAKRMWCDPRLTNAKPLTVSLEEFHQCVIAQGFVSSFSFSADKKHVRTLNLLRALRHHVIAYCLQRFRLVQIHNPFSTGFRPHSLWVIGAIADGDTTSSVRDIFESKVQYLTWPQPAMEHEKKHGLIPLETQGCNERGYLFICHGTRDALNGFDMDHSTNRSLPGGSAHERAMAVRDACVGRIVHSQDGIFEVAKLTSNDQVLVEGGNSGKDAIDGRWR